MRTHYQVLGIQVEAEDAELRKAYRALVLKYHPDRSSDPDAKDRFLEVQAAYECLNDPRRRKDYDSLLALEEAIRAKKPISESKKSTPPKQAPKPTAPKVQTKVKREISGPDLLRLTQMMSRGRYAEAERLGNLLMQEDNRHPIPVAVLADIYRYRGDHSRAAQMYGYAIQIDPKNQIYQQRYEDALKAMERGKRHAMRLQPGPASGSHVAGGLGIAVACGCYVALHHERPVLPGVGFIDTWTFGLMVMLFLAGIAMGASMSMGGALEPFFFAHGKGLTRIPPAALLGVIASVNFWAAAGMYGFMGVGQNTFNPSASRMVGIGAGLTILMSICAAANGTIDPLQTLIWGGNLAYAGGLCGWMVADGLNE